MIPAGAVTFGSSSLGPSEPPIWGAAGSPRAGPPAAATWCAADGNRFSTGAAPTAPPGGTIRTSGVPTGTTPPAFTRISAITPSYGLGISESTLSVDTSNSGSSNSTASPTCLSQLVSSPSVTVSPNLGMVTNHSSFDILDLPQFGVNFSAVQRTAGEGDHGFADGLGEARVCVNQPADVTGQGLPVHRQVTLVQQLTGPRADQMEAQDRTVLLGDNLDQAVGFAQDHGAPVAGEG